MKEITPTFATAHLVHASELTDGQRVQMPPGMNEAGIIIPPEIQEAWDAKGPGFRPEVYRNVFD